MDAEVVRDAADDRSQNERGCDHCPSLSVHDFLLTPRKMQRDCGESVFTPDR